MCDTYCGRKNLTGNLAGQDMSRVKAVQYPNHSLCDYAPCNQQNEGVQQMEVVSRGSKLMKRLHLPTVFIKLRKGELQNSKVYYVILQSESGRYQREIPALMFSNPSSGRITQTAELLPLNAEVDSNHTNCAAFTPMLLNVGLKRLFRRGSTFRVKELVGGRLVDLSDKEPWNKWNIKLNAIRMMITDIIYQDMRGMPTDMMKSVVRPTDSHSVSRSSLSLTSQSVSRSSVLSTSSESSSRGSLRRNLSAHFPTLEFTGVTASGGSSFAKWFERVPPYISVDRNFRCDHGTVLGRDRFADPETYFKYLNL